MRKSYQKIICQRVNSSCPLDKIFRLTIRLEFQSLPISKEHMERGLNFSQAKAHKTRRQSGIRCRICKSLSFTAGSWLEDGCRLSSYHTLPFSFQLPTVLRCVQWSKIRAWLTKNEIRRTLRLQYFQSLKDEPDPLLFFEAALLEQELRMFLIMFLENCLR